MEASHDGCYNWGVTSSSTTKRMSAHKVTSSSTTKRMSAHKTSNNIQKGSGYGYGTVPGGRWTIDTEGGHVVVSVSLIRKGIQNGYEYGTVPHLRGTIHTESGHVVNSVS